MENIQSKTPPQVADREGFSQYFFIVASTIDASSENRNDFVLLPRTGRQARSSNKKAISS